MKMRSFAIGALFTAGAFLGATTMSGCGCKTVLPTQITPGSDINLAPGDSTTVTVTQGGNCGSSPTRVDTRFLSSDMLVARVDSVTGHVTAGRIGEARIWIGYAGLPLSASSHTFEVFVHVR